MARCVVNSTEAALLAGYMPCGREAEPGKKRCRECLDRQKAANRRQYLRTREARKAASPPKPPAWMSDPSLLPKRPPGAR